MRRDGLSYVQICTVLNAARIPTPMGGSRWQKSHVDRLLHTKWVQELADTLPPVPEHPQRPDRYPEGNARKYLGGVPASAEGERLRPIP